MVAYGSPNKSSSLIIIAGPTAVGKTTVAIDVAQHFDSPIISADSRQFYKGMTIGTAAPDAEQLNRAKHYFIGHLNPEEYFNVSKFEKEVLKLLNKLFTVHDIIILTGGSGLYIKAVCDGIDDLPDIDPAIRNNLQSLYSTEGLPALRQLLYKLDTEYAEKVDLANPNRLIRALEVTIQTGIPYSKQLSNIKADRKFNIIKIALDLPREILHSRINARVDGMIRQGLIEEARSLYPLKQFNSLNTVGYREMFDYFDNKLSLEDAIEKIKTNTRRYARRQITWFKRDKTFHWLPPETPQVIEFINRELDKKKEG